MLIMSSFSLIPIYFDVHVGKMDQESQKRRWAWFGTYEICKLDQDASIFSGMWMDDQ